MKKFLYLLVLTSVTPLVFAQSSGHKFLLDKVSFQVSAKQWVSTQTALLSVSINATLNDADLVKARNDVITSLDKIAKGEWHLVEFNRSQDTSGLEKLYVNAQARVDQAMLTDVYKNAKAVSLPGAQYQISGIEFKPSMEEIQSVRANIRQVLYKQINDELANLNKAYPHQNYSLSQLVFAEGEAIPQTPRAYQAKEVNAMAVGDSLPGVSLSVSNEIQMTALVEAASNRKEVH
ncbi:MAG: hypothetical protein H0U75_11295 [Legionella sp.]|nr:hypothetical protein [Legionella sp.]